jgi:hypothetical protein
LEINHGPEFDCEQSERPFIDGTTEDGIVAI